MECVNESKCDLATYQCPPNDTLLNYFTQLVVCQTLEIPSQKPDKEYITNVIKNVVICDADVIDVDLGDNVPRKKLVFSGTIKLGLEYSADEAEQHVHFAHFDIPFQGFMGFRPCDPATNRGLIIDPAFDLDNYNIHVCVEHDQYHQLSPRLIKAFLVILVWLEPKP